MKHPQLQKLFNSIENLNNTNANKILDILKLIGFTPSLIGFTPSIRPSNVELRKVER
ncbi:MAG: hypothetical protein WC188_03995 [Candidatus Caldatribacteriota bacterium]|nr:hypothetical protein [Patescibacteria group bacterium]